MEKTRKHIRSFHNDCDDHRIKTDSINKVQDLLTKDFDSVKNEMFDDLRLQVFLNEIAIHEDKTDKKIVI